MVRQLAFGAREMDLSGRVALVTGGVRRVGLAIANAIANAGARVIVTARSGESPFETVHADLSTRDGIASLTERVPDVDLLVNSAANFIREDFANATWEHFDETFALNVRAPFFLAQHYGTRMKARGFGRIVNMADVAATIPWPPYLAYSMSKGAIVTMTKGLAKALAPAVLVNAIAPGPVMLPDDFDAAAMQQAVEPTLLKRPGSAEEVARAVVFLLESDYVTGVTLAVDGGRLLR